MMKVFLGWFWLAVSLFGTESYSFVDLGLTDEEKEAAMQLQFDRVRGFDRYDRFGALGELQGELIEFFKGLGSHSEDVAKRAARVIERTVEFVLQTTGKESAWVCVRVFRESSFFDQPRWHTDGRYFGFDDLFKSQTCVKFAAALKGPGTLFYPVSEEEGGVFQAHRNDRGFLARFLDPQKAIQARPGEGAFFVVADPLHSAVHSEPPLTEDRLFFSVLPGSNEEIQELFGRWHPRKN